MQISSTHNLPVSVGNHLPQPQRARHQHTGTASAVSSPSEVSTPVDIQRLQPTRRTASLYEQSLSHRGEQARRTYQDVALIGELLVNRLDVTA